MITIERAIQSDIETIHHVIRAAFQQDKDVLGEGPELFEHPETIQKYVSSRKMWLIFEDGNSVGCLTVFVGSGREACLGCLAILPEYQNRGIGSEVLRWIENNFRATRLWRLDTPAYQKRNQHFYEKNGYVKTDEFHDGIDLYHYEKDLDVAEIDPDGGCLYKDIHKLGFKTEFMEDLIRIGDARFERIISRGQTSPDTGYYDQTWTEIVLVVSGKAVLEIEGREYELRAGDWRCIHPHQRHRVVSTSCDPPCVWYAVHLGEGDSTSF